MRHVHSPRRCLPRMVLLLTVIVLGMPLARALSDPHTLTYTLRFSDMPSSATLLSSRGPTTGREPATGRGHATGRAAPQAPANAWFEQHGWQQVWPPTLFGVQQ